MSDRPERKPRRSRAPHCVGGSSALGALGLFVLAATACDGRAQSTSSRKSAVPLRLEVEAHGCYEAAADCGNECNWYLWIDNREVAASPSPEPCPGDTVYEGELERGQFFELGLHIEHAPHEQRARLSAYLDGELCRTVVAEGYNIGGTVLRGELRNGEARCWGPDDEEQ